MTTLVQLELLNPQARGFPAGTRLSFNNASAPTGWTKDTDADLNDAVLRIVTADGGGKGGTRAFSTVNAQTVVGSTTLANSQAPSHAHADYYQSTSRTLSATGCQAQLGGILPVTNTAEAGAWTTGGASGGGGSHNHTISMSMKYSDFIIASKD